MNEAVQQGSENGDSRTPDMVVQGEVLMVPVTEGSLTAASTAASWQAVTEAFLSAAVDSTGTRRAYARHLKRAGDLFGHIPVGEVSGADLAAYRATITESGLSPSSQAQALSALRSFLHWSGAMRAHQLPEEVIATALRTPRASVGTHYIVITEREIGAMLSAAPSHRERAILAVLLGAGLRVAEAAHLAVTDIVEDSEGGMALFVRQGKGRKDRVVPIGPEVVHFHHPAIRRSPCPE